MKSNHTPKRFIALWQKSDSPDEVATKLGLKKATVIQIASNYRSKKKVPLHKMPRGVYKGVYDWEALAKFAKSLRKVS